MGKNDIVLALILGGVGGGVIGYGKGHSNGYENAKSEDAAYINSLENDNVRLLNLNRTLQAELSQERRTRMRLQEELTLVKRPREISSSSKR